MTKPAIKENLRGATLKPGTEYAGPTQTEETASLRSPLGLRHSQNQPEHKTPMIDDQCDSMTIKSPTGSPVAPGVEESEPFKYVPNSPYGYLPLPPSPSSKPFVSPSSTGYADGSDLFRCPSSNATTSGLPGADLALSPHPAPSDPRSPKQLPKEMGLGLGDLNVGQGPRIGTFQSFDRDIDDIFGPTMTNSAAPTPFSSPSMPKNSSPLARCSSPKYSNLSSMQKGSGYIPACVSLSPLHPIKRHPSCDLRRAALEMSGLPSSSSDADSLLGPDICGLPQSESSRWSIPSQSSAPAFNASQFADPWMGYQKVIDSPTWSTLAQCPGTPHANSHSCTATADITESLPAVNTSDGPFVSPKSFAELISMCRDNSVAWVSPRCDSPGPFGSPTAG